ncbi:hypothetical protein Franean1_4455 [Parafrankia sp. EAN1pec]|nr:hypothetical protein Franean1_4455 [Frankia sp. EAN1pec]
MLRSIQGRTSAHPRSDRAPRGGPRRGSRTGAVRSCDERPGRPPEVRDDADAGVPARTARPPHDGAPTPGNMIEKPRVDTARQQCED